MEMKAVDEFRAEEFHGLICTWKGSIWLRAGAESQVTKTVATIQAKGDVGLASGGGSGSSEKRSNSLCNSDGICIPSYYSLGML